MRSCIRAIAAATAFDTGIAAEFCAPEKGDARERAAPGRRGVKFYGETNV